ncbi:hypothetical protein D3C87_1772210 [compost metagenome]
MPSAAFLLSSSDLRNPSVSMRAESSPLTPIWRISVADRPAAAATSSTTVGIAARIVSQASASTLPLFSTLLKASVALDARATLVAFFTKAKDRESVTSREASRS